MEKKQNPEWEGDFNREDSNTEKRARKSVKPEEEPASPFARDKRPRIRRVTEELNERTPRPRINREGEENNERVFRPRTEREGEERQPYRREEKDGRHFQERRYPDNRSGEESQENRRRSYNPNFDENNRLKPSYRREESSEEDNRFNSYNYDRERQQRGNRPSRNDSYSRNDKPYTPRTDRNREDQDDRPRYNREDRPQKERYGRENQSGDRGGRPYQRDDRGNRPYQRDDRENRPYQKDDRGNRPYQRDDRGSRPYQKEDRGDTRFNKDRRNAPSWDKRKDNRGGKPEDPFKTPKGGYNSEYKPKIYPAYSAANIQEPIRLNKFISMSGLCSRREADEFIKEGNITVNGEVITEMGVKIQPTDEICFNGEVLQGEKRVYILMNKPKGFVTTVEDPNADRTVMDIVKNACKERVYPVGRLDKNSLGVLLITNDGELTKRLTHPSHEKKKIYQVTLDRPATVEELNKLYDGVELVDGVAKADEVEFLDEGRREIGITIHTGRNRIVRRMFEELGYHVQKLDRVYFSGLTKKGLRRGAWRYLTPKEVAMLKSGAYE